MRILIRLEVRTTSENKWTTSLNSVKPGRNQRSRGRCWVLGERAKRENDKQKLRFASFLFFIPRLTPLQKNKITFVVYSLFLHLFFFRLWASELLMELMDAYGALAVAPGCHGKDALREFIFGPVACELGLEQGDAQRCFLFTALNNYANESHANYHEHDNFDHDRR